MRIQWTGWLTLLLVAGPALGATSDLSSTSGTPDLSGTYDTGTLTPLERPAAFGDNLFLAPEQAQRMAAGFAAAQRRDAADSDPERAAPPATGKLTTGYNLFWVDPGQGATLIDGRFRTSLITSPANGRKPEMTAAGAARMAALIDAWHIVWRDPDPTTDKDGQGAWWLRDGAGVGPYDHPEQRPLAERCIIGSRSTAGPPMLSNFYNNHKRIVQSPGHVMILTEMIHDARIVRMNAAHRPDHVRTWLGDSVGHWEGETLVVHTAGFNDTPALSGADRNLEVTERFTRLADGNLLYQFTVVDPTVWTSPWSGELIWRSTADKVYEFACHEGNYALTNVLRGARELERAHTGQPGASPVSGR